MKIRKLISIFLIIYILINIFNSITLKVYASSEEGNPFEEAINDVKQFTEGDSVGSTATIPLTTDKLQNVSKIVSSILFIISVGVALATTAALGINLMVQSAEDKAKTKEALIPLVIGMLISFGAYGIWKAMVFIFGKL